MDDNPFDDGFDIDTDEVASDVKAYLTNGGDDNVVIPHNARRPLVVKTNPTIHRVRRPPRKNSPFYSDMETTRRERGSNADDPGYYYRET